MLGYLTHNLFYRNQGREKEKKIKIRKKIKCNNEDPIPDPKKIKLFKHFSEEIEANKEFNFYVSSEHTIMDLYQHLVDGHYIYIKGNRQSGKTTSIIATVNLLQEKSNANELLVPDLEVYLITFDVGIDIRNGKMSFWLSMCKLFRARNSKWFSFNDSREYGANVFINFFFKKKNGSPISFIIDDFSNVFEEPLILEEFINMLQLLKNYSTYCVHSFALVGVGRFPIQTELVISNIIIPCFFNENEIRMLLNQYSEHMCNNEYGKIYRLLVEGIVVSKSVNEDYIEMEFSSPILRSIILSIICGPDIDITNPLQTINKIDINWLLENTIEITLNADNNLSEYAFQAEFSAVLKYLLSNVYPVLQYRVIVEVKERDINGNRHKRLDIFLRDHDLPTYGFELVVNKKNFEVHLNCANYYKNLHGCSLYLINLCTNSTLVDRVESGHQEVTLVDIIYNISNRKAEIVYEDYKKSISIKRSAWKVAFD
ncbi:polyketide biosynthesis operon protein cyro: PROVISIONAL [Gigaspora margarita]|uniref:Polyketide biosynthesis operon protein cyro: PROVISIONAL n=1 Tax=Gigaspora margarita TaxID=4874 RepID=A0A8H3WYT8_GIGMA|nr:polyketide biosynthesis operon protein cyro: PROVISIONAL [Gigaspora margarita]